MVVRKRRINHRVTENIEMKKYIVLILAVALLAGCHHKQKPIEPPEPTPGVEQPTPEPAPEPTPPTPTPTPTPRPKPPTQQAPPIKPRTASPGDAAALKLVTQGVKQMNAGDLESAEQVFEQALRISPSYAKPYYYLGVVSYKKGDYKRSLAFLEQSEMYSYGDDFWQSQVLLHEGLCYKAMKMIPTAKQKLQMAVEKDPTNDWAQSELKKLTP